MLCQNSLRPLRKTRHPSIFRRRWQITTLLHIKRKVLYSLIGQVFVFCKTQYVHDFEVILVVLVEFGITCLNLSIDPQENVSVLVNNDLHVLHHLHVVLRSNVLHLFDVLRRFVHVNLFEVAIFASDTALN
jgi:hypothetical protein